MRVLKHLPEYASEILPENHVEDARKIVTEKLEPLASGVEDHEIVVILGIPRGQFWTLPRTTTCIVSSSPVIAGHRPGMQDLFLGSTAAVRNAKCAVHVVR